ncbi:MAG: serine hydrolase [Pseudomonadota bacterium]
MMRKLARGGLILIVAAISIGLVLFLRSDYHRNALPTVSGITAKQICSMAFLTGLEPERTRALYLTPQLDWAADLVSSELDREERSATASVYGMYQQKAVYREGLGCTLDHDGALDRSITVPLNVADRALPEAAPERFDPLQTEQALDRAFEEPAGGNRNTLAVVALHNGEVIAERYAQGIDRNTPLLGWSMSKSATATLAGVMARRGEVELTARGAVDSPATPEITLEHLLRMSSGLAIDERNDGTDPSSLMLWSSPDMAKFAASRPQRHAPGEVFDYMSGSTNLAMRHLQNQLGPDLKSQVLAVRGRLFEPLGMSSAIIEPDTIGTMVGSSYMWATARDWAKLGQLYLDDGVVDGRRLLDPSWIDAVGQRSADSENYGMGFWLYRRSDDLPDVLDMDGFQGQNVVIVPSHSLVIVRLGATNRTDPGVSRLVKDLVEIVSAVD